MQEIKPPVGGTRSLGQVISSLAAGNPKGATMPRAFGRGFYAEVLPESKFPISTFTPGPIVEDRLTF